MMDRINEMETRMEDIQKVIEKVSIDLQEGRSEEEIFQSLLSLLGKDLELTVGVVEQLAGILDAKIGRLLQRMLEIYEEKRIRKAIKRSLYRLRSRGITIEEILPEKKESILRPLTVQPPKGFGNGYDISWNRFLILTFAHPGKGSIVLHGLVNDPEGLINFYGGEISKKELKNFFEEVQKASPTPVVEMEASYVAFLFTRAYQTTLMKGRTPPSDYVWFKGEVEKIKKEYERSLIYSYLEPEAIEGDERFLRRGGDLLRTDLFASWVIGDEEIRPYADEVWEAEESRLILNPNQKEARFQEVYQRALSNLFPEEKRLLYQYRMEEMAYLLFKLGREEEAKISLAVALDLKKPINFFQPNPFLYQLVIKSIYAFLKEAYEKKREEFSLIQRP